MKKYLVIFFIFAVWFSGGLSRAFAQETPVVSEQINARILPLIWYSTLSIKDGDSVKIYAGIQNNSGVTFSGTANFYVDDKIVSQIPFISSGDSLNPISADWLVSSGAHNIQVKIETSLSADKTLVSYESAKSNITITRKITQEMVKDTVVSTVYNVITKVDEAVAPLIDKIEALKKPVINDIQSDIDQNENVGSILPDDDTAVLGVATSSVSDSGVTKNNNQINSIFNMAIDGLAFLVKHWLWTLGGIVLLFLIIKIRRRRNK